MIIRRERIRLRPARLPSKSIQPQRATAYSACAASNCISRACKSDVSSHSHRAAVVRAARGDYLLGPTLRTRSQAPCARRQCAASRRAVARHSPRTYICSAAPRAQARAGPLCAMISRERQTPLECCSSRSSPHRDAALYDRERISTSVHNNTPKQLEFQPPLLRHSFRSRRPQRHDDCGDVVPGPAVVDRC